MTLAWRITFASLLIAIAAGCGSDTEKRASEDSAVDWSRAVVDSTMQRNPDPARLGTWAYARSLFLYGEYLVWKRTGEARYFQYVRGWIDAHVDDQGNIDRPINALDDMLPGRLLLVLYKETGQLKYKLAADRIRQRFDTWPRTSDGGLWHSTSLRWQLWSDGTYMSMPFLAGYGQTSGDSVYANAEAAGQLLVYASHLQDRSGLLYHAYDESGESEWADPATHHSSEFWGRAIGWYGMALIEVLEVLPLDHPQRGRLLVILQDLVKALARYQDPKTGLWFQVVNRGELPSNWLETSSSSMYTYVTSKAVEKGYVPASYRSVAQKGYDGVLSKLSLRADSLTYLVDIGVGTNVGSLSYYLDRPRSTNDFHGLGAFLIMNEQLRHQNR